MSKMRLAAYKAWETNYKRIYGFTDEELEGFLKEKYQEQIIAQEKKKIRDIIRKLGGVNDSDYEFIPTWAKRKKGRRLDEIALEISDYLPEYHIEEAEDVYKLLNKAGA